MVSDILLTHCPQRDMAVISNGYFLQYIVMIAVLCISSEIAPQVNTTGLHSWQVNIGSGNGLVPSGSKSLPDPLLTKFYCHMASAGVSELRYDDFHTRKCIWKCHMQNGSHFAQAFICVTSIDLLHKYHTALVWYPTMHHFVTEMCTYFCYEMVHCGIFVQCYVGFVRCSYRHWLSTMHISQMRKVNQLKIL